MVVHKISQLSEKKDARASKNYSLLCASHKIKDLHLMNYSKKISLERVSFSGLKNHQHHVYFDYLVQNLLLKS